MPKLPRDISGEKLISLLGVLGYQATRQRGSHVRVTTVKDGVHSEVIPLHRALKPSTLNTILRRIAEHHGLTKQKLVELLFRGE